MRFRPRLTLLLILFGLPWTGNLGRAEETPAGPGTKIDILIVGATTYHQVQVRSLNARTLMMTHRGGMTSIRLRDLPPEWQRKFRYDPIAEAAAEEAARNMPPPPVSARPTKTTTTPAPSKIDALLQAFGQPVAVQRQVDLRPKFFQLELGVKNQGRRPSCAVFAIVSALEFQNAESTGKAEKFSEEYLSWAVSKTVRRLPVPGTSETEPSINKEDADAGYALAEVVAALRAYGIPLQASMPNTFGRSIGAIEEPPPPVIAEARNLRKVFVHQLPGRDAATLLNNVVQVLNAGFPVAVGMAWPNYRSIPNGYLSGQKPMPHSGHAVTLVGYLSATGQMEDTVFIFKNSWGTDWGQGGYGTATYGYLSKHLNDAVLLEIQPAKL